MTEPQSPTCEPTTRHDVTASVLPRQMVECTDEPTRRFFEEAGRVEDVAIDPSNRRLALAAFDLAVIGIVEFDVDRAAGTVRFGGVVQFSVDGMVRPHGLAFADDSTLLVANRQAEVILIELGDDALPVRSRAVLDRGSFPAVRSPGSLCARWIGDDLLEVMVCNNYVHDVTRHVLDRSRDWEVVDGEVLLRQGLAVPDGIAVEPRGRWIAVSNHLKHEVLIHRFDEELGPDRDPVGVLTGPNYAHGLSFSADGRHLLVADAGLPYVMTYTAPDGDWSGDRSPAKITRVKDDDEFSRRRSGPGEGGPKGVALAGNAAVIVASEFHTACFDADQIFVDQGLDAGAAGGSATVGDDPLDRWRRVAEVRAARNRVTERVTPLVRVRHRVGGRVALGARRSGRRLLRMLPVRTREHVMHVTDQVAAFIRDDAL